MVLDDKNITVLVVDDDEINRQMAQMILTKKLPYKIYTAQSGMKAVEIMHQLDINLVLLDVTMPIWDGFKTLEVMRGEKRLRDIPVILLTASADISTVVRAKEYGVKDYIKKPFLPEELVGRVAKAIWEEWKKVDARRRPGKKDRVAREPKFYEEPDDFKDSDEFGEPDEFGAETRDKGSGFRNSRFIDEFRDFY